MSSKYRTSFEEELKIEVPNKIDFRYEIPL